MKQRFVLAGVLMLVCALTAGAQDKIAILPFTGGQGNEGETVAELFAGNEQLNGRFRTLLRTSIARPVEEERYFQNAAKMTDTDTAVKLGKEMGAQYVMTGNITAIGNQKLLVVAIIRIEAIQQVAGDYKFYARAEELRGTISDVVQNLLPMLNVDTSGMEKLAVPPLQLDDIGEASERDADTLAQILSIELLRNGKYAIYPRTTLLAEMQKEFGNQDSLATDKRVAAQLGKGENPTLALSVVARKLGSLNMFNATIFDLERGDNTPLISEEYANLTDGITVMRIIAGVLSGQEVSVGNREWQINFNRNTRLVFELQGGLSFIPKDLVSARIFGEPASEYDTNKSTKNSDGTTTTRTSSTETPTRLGIPLELLVGFQYSAFSINTGVSFGITYAGPSQLEYSFVQVPLLLRGEFFNFLNIFGGFGFNFPLTATAKLAQVAYGPKTTQNATLTMSPSLLFGITLSPWVMENTAYSIGVRGSLDVAETKVKLEGGKTGSFSRTFAVDIVLGIKFRRSLFGNDNSFQGVPQNQGQIKPTSATPPTW
jgi:hypothetical protein